MRKPQNLLIAQVGAFASNELENPSDYQFALDHADFLAGLSVERSGAEFDVVYGREEVADERVVGFVGRYFGLYEEFIREADRDEIKYRRRLFSNYDDNFRDEVAALRLDIERSEGDFGEEEWKQHPDFVDIGSHSVVFKLNKDGRSYAVRFVILQESDSHVDQYLSGARLTVGVPHMEQIVAASYEHRATVAELIDGRDMDSLTLEELSSIEPRHLEVLIDRSLEAVKIGVQFEGHSGNFIFTPEDGFVMVDYTSEHDVQAGEALDSEEDVLMELFCMFEEMYFRLRGSLERDEMNEVEAKQHAHIIRGIMASYIDVVSGKFGKTYQDAVSDMTIALGSLSKF